jgi:hypothetical protein
MIELTIYVPRPGTFLREHIRKGSGIVGSEDQHLPGQVLIDYEGATLGQKMTFEEKVFHAAGRHHWKVDGKGRVHRYPTGSRAAANPSEVIAVGTFRCQDDWSGCKYLITNQDALDEWLK